MQISYLKQITSVFLLLLLTVSYGFSQSTENLMPYNPDADNSGSIEVVDLMSLLTFFGSPFAVEGALPIESGGTGATTAEDARLALTVSLFSDITPLGEENPSATISGDLTLNGKLQQGSGSLAEGDFSSALGVSTSASGYASHAEGELTSASGYASHAEGELTSASNITAHAEGYGTTASGLFSHAENRNSIATATCAHAEGENTSATADASHSEGMNTEASGFTAHAEGYGTNASAAYSHSGGLSTTASATGSFAHGFQLVSDQNYSTVFGRNNLLERDGTLLVVGNGISGDDDDRSNIFEIDSDGALVNGDIEITGSVTSNGVDLVEQNESLSNSVIGLESEISSLNTLILDLQVIVGDLQDQINLLTE